MSFSYRSRERGKGSYDVARESGGEGCVSGAGDELCGPARLLRGRRLRGEVREEEELLRVLGADRERNLVVARARGFGAHERGVEKAAELPAHVPACGVLEQQPLRLAAPAAVDVHVHTRSFPFLKGVVHVGVEVRLERPRRVPRSPDVALKRLQRWDLEIAVHHRVNGKRGCRAHFVGVLPPRNRLNAALHRRRAERRQVRLRLRRLKGVSEVLFDVGAGIREEDLRDEAHGHNRAFDVENHSARHIHGRKLRLLHARAFAVPVRRRRRWQTPLGRGSLGSVHPELLELDRRLKEVVEALRLRLCLHPRVSPNIDTVAAHENRRALWILGDGVAQALRELALSRSVLDDRDAAVVVEAVLFDALDHLEVGHMELRSVRVDDGGEHRLHCVRVHHGTRAFELVRSHEQRRAL
mmetsp:Transcript_12411/g.40898  ORF Transcript_12411/g.40898 Transcript_12411/m.40898 type:complete len:412 (+) Transcript_12411:297-1532(+)